MNQASTQKYLRRAVVKNLLRRLLAVITIAGLLYGFVAVVYATKTIFKVKMNYAVVLERFGGKREAVTQVGWHFRLPYFTRIEQEVPLMNQRCCWAGEWNPCGSSPRKTWPCGRHLSLPTAFVICGPGPLKTWTP